MDIELLREYCLSLPGTEDDLKWGENLCFMLEQKIYALASLDTGSLTFKCNPEEFEEWTELLQRPTAPIRFLTKL